MGLLFLKPAAYLKFAVPGDLFLFGVRLGGLADKLLGLLCTRATPHAPQAKTVFGGHGISWRVPATRENGAKTTRPGSGHALYDW